MLVMARATSGEEDDWESIRDESVARYLEVAAIIVIRLLRINAKDLAKKLPFASLQSVVIFLDLVRESLCPSPLPRHSTDPLHTF